jgi:acyl carrier protein
VPDDRLITELRRFVADEFLGGKDEGLDAATPLIDWGVIDSIAIVALRAFVLKRFGVDIPNAELKPSNLTSLGTIAALVERLQERRLGIDDEQPMQ